MPSRGRQTPSSRTARLSRSCLEERQHVCPHSFVFKIPKTNTLSAQSWPNVRQIKQLTSVIPRNPGGPRSAPGVAAVLEVVVLELALIFDLVDQNLGQEDANQLGARRDSWLGQLQTVIVLIPAASENHEQLFLVGGQLRVKSSSF